MSHIRHMLHNLLINAAFIMLPHMSHIHTLLINAAFRMLPVDVSHVDETHAYVMWHTSTKLMHMWCGTRPRNSCICDVAHVHETHAYVMTKPMHMWCGCALRRPEALWMPHVDENHAYVVWLHSWVSSTSTNSFICDVAAFISDVTMRHSYVSSIRHVIYEGSVFIRHVDRELRYVMAPISRLLKIIGLFCRI